MRLYGFNAAPPLKDPAMPEAMTIADATEEDLPGLAAIYNEVIANSTAIYSSTPVTLEDRRQWWQARIGRAIRS